MVPCVAHAHGPSLTVLGSHETPLVPSSQLTGKPPGPGTRASFHVAKWLQPWAARLLPRPRPSDAASRCLACPAAPSPSDSNTVGRPRATPSYAGRPPAPRALGQPPPPEAGRDS
eukprot:351513-Chlamydomonas_euryale.AAC.2